MLNKAREVVKNMVMKLLNIQPATEHSVNIVESLTHKEEVLKNELWYRGDPSELDQFFKQTAKDNVSKSRFWAAVPSEDNSIRKYHSGLPSEIIDKLAAIVIEGLDGINIENEEYQNIWNEIDNDNKFTQEGLSDAITKALAQGDGAFKLTIDKDITEYPIIEFYSAAEVDYVYKRGRLHEYLFSSYYTEKKETYRLVETYGPGYIKYNLYDSKDREVDLSKVPELNSLEDISYSGNFIMAQQLLFFKSPKYEGRGNSIYARKTDNFDSLDEVVSQWIDAIRAGRVKNYIPESLLPKDPNTGKVMRANPFDNQFIKTDTSMKEDSKDEIVQKQADINYIAFVESYASMLDMCLQGIISPATLGIDLKKTDNAEAQREKEKTTLYTRAKVNDVLTEVLPKLIDITLKTHYTDLKTNNKSNDINNASMGSIEDTITINFGEYASPDFDTKVDIVGKAKSFGIMSLEQSIEELYGDDWTDEEKEKEVERIRNDGDIFDEPAVKIDYLSDDNIDDKKSEEEKDDEDDEVIEDEE